MLELIRVNPDGERVQFRPDAAASFRRLEAQRGRQLDVNRTVVTWDEQNDLYQQRLRGVYPYTVAHPDESNHVYRSDTDGGNAWDTDERGPWLEDNGWIADVNGEPWHREYRPNRDNHRNTPTPTAPAVNQSEEDDMSILIRIDGGTSYTLEPFRGIKAHANVMGARLALRGRNKVWPPNEGPDFERFRSDERNGELQCTRQHAAWLADVYGLAELLPFPSPGQTKRF